jgi:hypothetical protein
MTKNHILLWSAILGLVAILGSYGLACVFPFAALAAIAAVTLPAHRAALLIGGVWAVNQIVGFALMHYGDSASAPMWGVIIAAGAFAALGAAKLAYGPETRLIAVRSAAALVAAIVAYQAVMFFGALALDGFASSTPDIVATIARNDAFWFAGLIALRLALTRGLPSLFAVPAVTRNA